MYRAFARKLMLPALTFVLALSNVSSVRAQNTPIKHVVVIFQENVSFDHYFGTYPNALNLSGETPFVASKHTPKVNNLANPLDVNNDFGPLAGVDLLNNNPNSNPNAPAAPDNAKTNGIAATMNVLGTSNNLLHGTHEAFGDTSQTTSNITVIGDGDPLLDACSNPSGDQVTLAGKNIGDLLNDKGITWGSFMGGFDLGVVNANSTIGCARQTNPTAPGTPAFTSVDYIPHHAWFQYYASTRNPAHARPSSIEAIGHSLIPHTNTPEPANHNYDINDFFATLKAGNLPAVSFPKAAAVEDGHAGYSDPIDEKHFLVP